ncbi:MAG: transglycosylase SLT domain-containing protein [Chromatiales bacterium]
MQNLNRLFFFLLQGTPRYASPVLLAVLMAVSGPLMAEIFKYRGPDGSIHFTDRPMSSSFKLLWKIGKPNPPKSASKGSYSSARMQQNKSLLTPMIEQTAKQLRLHPGLLHAIVLVESAYNPKATSSKGAQGLMQLMPGTAERYGVSDAYDPRQNLRGGARYLKDLLALFKYDLKLALAAYNAGEGAVKKYGNEIPPYPETQNYVKKVMGHYRKNMLALN